MKNPQLHATPSGMAARAQVSGPMELQVKAKSRPRFALTGQSGCFGAALSIGMCVELYWCVWYGMVWILELELTGEIGAVMLASVLVRYY